MAEICQFAFAFKLYDVPAGKKIVFYGGEIGQWNEWNCKSEIEWFLLLHRTHSGVQKMVKELNRLYLDNSCLWEHDFDHLDLNGWIFPMIKIA